MSGAEDAGRVLTRTLICSQCGNPFSERACGPTHAVIAADVTRHYLIGPLTTDAEERGIARGAEIATRWVIERIEAVLTAPEFHIEVALGGSDYVRDTIRAALAGAPATEETA